MQMNTNYDVIIVGGRVAGSTLAAYLGKAGVSVLMLERAVFPEDHPASSPIIQPVTLAMLDEIGADEGAYARNTPKIRQVMLSDGDFQAELPMPEIGGRAYAYAIDRARFDHALWENALSYDNADGYMGFSVTSLLWDSMGKTVIGVEGKHNGEKKHITSTVVVGADGRFSLVARKVGAQEHDKHEDHPTSIYYAHWKGVEPYDADNSTIVGYAAPTPTYGFLVMPSADGMAMIGMEGRADALAPPKGTSAEDFYMGKVQENPQMWARLQNAERVSPVRGMKKIGNMFRQPGGLGWALTGDAYHQKDPIDGQGIYDAVFTSRTLAQAMIAWREGEKTWDEALGWYDETVRAEAVPMYEATMFRVQQQMYPSVNVQIPRFVWETPFSLLYNDPHYKKLVGYALNRQVDPSRATAPRELAMGMLRGGLRKISDQLGKYERA